MPIHNFLNTSYSCIDILTSPGILLLAKLLLIFNLFCTAPFGNANLCLDLRQLLTAETLSQNMKRLLISVHSLEPIMSFKRQESCFVQYQSKAHSSSQSPSYVPRSLWHNVILVNENNLVIICIIEPTFNVWQFHLFCRAPHQRSYEWESLCASTQT